MFNLDEAILKWRDELGRNKTVATNHLDELEDHLVSAFEAEVENGLAPTAAFEVACEDIGSVAEISAEFNKIKNGTWRTFMSAGWIMFVVAFLLPVYNTGWGLFGKIDSFDGLRGFEAFSLGITGELGLIGIISALTNVVMAITLWQVSRRDRAGVFMLAGILSAAAFLNLYWLVDGVGGLRLGYFMWLASFASVSTGYILRARELSDEQAPLSTI